MLGRIKLDRFLTESRLHVHNSELNRLTSVGLGRALDTRNPSYTIWQDCPYFDLVHGVRDGIAFFDDFNRSMIQAANVAASATTLVDPWVAFTDATAASTISSINEPTDALGALSLAITTANEGMTLGLFTQKALGTCISGGLASAASTPIANKVWLEARIKVSTIGANEIAFFLGLVEKTQVKTLGCMATTSVATAAVDNIGFLKPATGTSSVSTWLGNGTSAAIATGVATLVADTYINLGFTWDGSIGSLGLAKFWVNGVANATTVDSSTTNFPVGEGLSPHISAQSGSTAGDDVVTLDWLRFAYLRTL